MAQSGATMTDLTKLTDEHIVTFFKTQIATDRPEAEVEEIKNEILRRLALVPKDNLHTHHCNCNPIRGHYHAFDSSKFCGGL